MPIVTVEVTDSVAVSSEVLLAAPNEDDYLTLANMDEVLKSITVALQL